MRRLLLVALLLPFAGCSYMAQFVVANRSAAAVRVTYRIDNALVPASYRNRGCLLDQDPQRFVLGRKDGVTDDKRLAHETRTNDAAGCSVALMLPPGHGVVVWQAVNYRPGKFNRPFLTTLDVAGPSLSRTFSGTDVVKVFERRSRTLYVLRVND